MKPLKQLFLFIILFSLALGNAPFIHAASATKGLPTGVRRGERKVFYYLHDHLGGISAVTDEQGNVVERRDYLPYGDERLIEELDLNEDDLATVQDKTDYGFTGKEQDPETELYYYGARYYDPMLGRFISQDPWEGDLTDPQTWNKYSYALNNPLKYIDPTGELVELVSRKVFFPLVGVFGTHTFLQITPDNPADFQNVDTFTVGAYKESDALVKAINHPSDNANNINEEDYRGTYTIAPPSGMTDTEFITSIMDVFSRYADDRDYNLTGMGTVFCKDSGNCNNFTTGLLQGAGVPPEVMGNINPDGANPGLGTPLPEMLDPDRTDRAQWQREFNQKAVAPAMFKQLWDKFKEKVKDFFTPEKKEDENN